MDSASHESVTVPVAVCKFPVPVAIVVSCCPVPVTVPVKSDPVPVTAYRGLALVVVRPTGELKLVVSDCPII